MINYATRLPPGAPVELLDNNLVRKTYHCYDDEWYFCIKALVNHFINQPVSYVVPVSNFITHFSEKNNHIYSYDMMRCGLLTETERKFIDLVGDLTDRHGKEAFKCSSLDLIIYSEEYPKLRSFLQFVVENTKYWDIHSGNIMRNEDGDYCLIDLEGFMKTPLDNPENNWIVR